MKNFPEIHTRKSAGKNRALGAISLNLIYDYCCLL